MSQTTWSISKGTGQHIEAHECVPDDFRLRHIQPSRCVHVGWESQLPAQHWRSIQDRQGSPIRLGDRMSLDSFPGSTGSPKNQFINCNIKKGRSINWA